jgi:predicted nucleotidyltransferase
VRCRFAKLRDSSAYHARAASLSGLRLDTADQQDRVIVDCLRDTVGDVIAVYRFGSTAHGTATRTSDTDVALLARERLSATRRFDVQEQLAVRLGHDVDLVDVCL